MQDTEALGKMVSILKELKELKKITTPPKKDYYNRDYPKTKEDTMILNTIETLIDMVDTLIVTEVRRADSNKKDTDK
jgi:hypothetical protein